MEQYIIKGGIALHGDVEIGGAKNAALLAVSILALQDPSLREQYIGFRRQQTEKVLATVI